MNGLAVGHQSEGFGRGESGLPPQVSSSSPGKTPEGRNDKSIPASIWWSAVLRARGAEAGENEVQARGGRRRELEGKGEVEEHLGLGFLLRESRELMTGDSSRYSCCTFPLEFLDVFGTWETCSIHADVSSCWFPCYQMVFNDIGAELADPSAISTPLRPAEVFKVEDKLC